MNQRDESAQRQTQQHPAPCIAVIGPANAGKTTLLHQLDERLEAKLDSFLVLKGTPDGIGRALYHSPELRNQPEFKQRVKGKWAQATVDHVCDWLENGRRNLSLALLDCGGRHDETCAESNGRMLRGCTHYLVVSRANDREGGGLLGPRGTGTWVNSNRALAFVCVRRRNATG